MTRRVFLSLLLFLGFTHLVWAQTCTSTPCVIIGSAGQSNEAGGNARWVNANDVGGSGTYMLNTQNGVGPPWTAANFFALADQMTNFVGGQGGLRIGSRVNFVKDGKPVLWPTSDVLVVTGAVGGVGFTGVNGSTPDPAGWTVGSDAYERFVALMQAMLALNAGNVCDSIFWGSGEKDGSNSVTIAAYIGYFTDMVADFRSRVPECANAPWFLRGMVPAYVASGIGWQSTMAAQQILGTNFPSSKFYFVTSQYPDLPGNYGADTAQSTDIVHFSAIAQRQLAGRELYQYITTHLCQPWPFGKM